YEDYLRRKEAQASAATNREQSSRPANVGLPRRMAEAVLYPGMTSVVPRNAPQKDGALAPAGSSPASLASNTFVIEGGFEPEPKEKPRRLNPLKQKQMEDRCAFLEEEVPRIESSIAHTEEQLGVYVSAAETERLTA